MKSSIKQFYCDMEIITNNMKSLTLSWMLKDILKLDYISALITSTDQTFNQPWIFLLNLTFNGIARGLQSRAFATGTACVGHPLLTSGPVPFGICIFSITGDQYFWLQLVLVLLGHLFPTFETTFWLRITDEGSVPDMRIWSILLI